MPNAVEYEGTVYILNPEPRGDYAEKIGAPYLTKALSDFGIETVPPQFPNRPVTNGAAAKALAQKNPNVTRVDYATDFDRIELLEIKLPQGMSAAEAVKALNNYDPKTQTYVDKNIAEEFAQKKAEALAAKSAKNASDITAASGVSFDGPFLPSAHLLVSYVKDDPRLNIKPEHIHDRFNALLDNGRSASGSEGALREAVYLFQSTELSPSHRAAFTPDEIGELFQLCLDNLNEETIQSLVEIYNTTQDTPAYRNAITPDMAKDAFQFCLDCATEPGKRSNPDFYAGQAILMLRYTIADNKLRSPQGISYRQIEALTRYYESVISKEREGTTSEPSSFNRGLDRSKIKIAFAKRSLEYIRICTLPSSDRDQVASLTSDFNGRTRNPQLLGPELFHASRCLLALARYPSAEPT